MKKRNVKYAVTIVVLISFVLLPVITEAGGLDLFKKTPKKAEQKAVQPKKQMVQPKPSAKVKQKKPSLVVASHKLAIGLEETYMTERNLKHSRFPGDIRFESLQHLGTLSYELVDWLSLKGKIGTARIKNEGWGYGWHDYELAWGAGGDWDVLKCLNRCFPTISPTLPYEISLKISGEYLAIGSDKETASTGSSLEEEWQEWSTSIAFSKNWGAFTPYLGTRLSWAQVKAKLDYKTSGVENFNGTLKADDHIGAFLGTDIDFSKCGKLGQMPFIKDLSTHFEVSAFDEVAFTAALKYTYKF